ncbi:MAG: ABC transporter permease, partial [Actinobacteria bacterium]|nr:ABC transporter permease [Actinomycetota bacterium]
MKSNNNLQTIYVMWLREIKKFFRAKSRLLGTIGMPFFFLLALGFGFSPMSKMVGAEGISYLDFLVPGMIGMSMLFASVTGGLSVLWDREFGFLKEIMVAPVSRWAIILGRIIGSMSTALIQGILILAISMLMGFKIVGLINVVFGIIFMILISAGFTGFGVAIASKLDDTQGFSLIMNFVIFPTFLLSGAFFPVTNFPAWL